MVDINDNNFTYGEIDCTSLLECLAYIDNKYPFQNSGTFIDFGHGSGKGLLAACLSGKFTSCVGVELLKNLFKQS
jgi:hypothetical protein